MPRKGWAFILLAVVALAVAFSAEGHRSGCHRWHSCPSDRGTYICGDLGYCSQCSDNQYCLAGQRRANIQPHSPESKDFRRTFIEFTGKVVGVTDGDTITVLHDRLGEGIRLHGIDCPEKGQAFGQRAKQFTSELAFGKDITVKVYDVDKYGRTIGDVILPDGRNLNQELVRAGMCWWYRKYAPDDEILAQLEASAREAKSGLWVDPNPVPPWEWRRRGGGRG